ncbi:MFS transporter|nr:MFS transporter [Candidatus Pantoea persica]
MKKAKWPVNIMITASMPQSIRPLRSRSSMPPLRALFSGGIAGSVKACHTSATTPRAVVSIT